MPARIWLDIGWHQGLCADISESGLGLNVLRRFEVGETLRITLQPPHSPDLHVFGKVVRSSQNGRLGIRIVEAEPDVRKELASWAAGEQFSRSA